MNYQKDVNYMDMHMVQNLKENKEKLKFKKKIS